MVEQKQFSGILNLDDNNDVLPSSHHKDAINIIFKGNGTNMNAENLPGTRLVSNTLPSGTNQTIGTHYDSLNNRIFYFNFNSNGTHGIYIYNTQASTFQTLIQSGTNTVGDVLGFTANPITSINIIYGDPTDGDILYYVDTLGRPTKLNVQRYLAGTYTSIQRSYLDVAKMPPSSPIKAAYGADTTTNTNNLTNGLFQFIYRFVYDDNEKSVWSTGSEVPLPFMPNNDGTITNAKYLNNYISLYFPTGDVNVKKIELAFRETRDGATTDYSLITSLVKSDLSIGSNDVYNYNFYKNGIYTFVEKIEQLLLFDYVPLKANAQELLNGSTLIYGGITEGYSNTPLNASITQQNSASSVKYTCRNGLLFGAEQISNNSIKIFVDGTIGTAAGTIASIYDTTGGGVVFNVNVTDGSNANLSFTYTATNTDFSMLLSGLASAASAKGFTTSVSGNFLTISKTGALLSSTLCQYNFNNLSNNNWEVIYSLYANAAYQYGIVYYDANGKTNGVNTIQALKLNTNSVNSYPDPEKEALYTYRQLTINNTPPSWAKYYQIVRTNNLTYGDKALYWVSSGAFSDKDVSVNQKYAYIRIDNIYDYNLSIKATEGVVGYTFAPGDRVKFIKLFNSTGSAYTDLASNNFDYPIISLETDPVMNGIAKTGSFLKIAYPTSDVSASFDFTSSPEYQNYEIFIYNPAATASASEQTYFEFGQKYNILNGYHGGNYQNQTTSQSAIINFYDGDVFFRNRNILVSPTQVITSQGIAGFPDKYWTVSIGDSSQDVVTSNYTIGHSVAQNCGGMPNQLAYNQYPSWGDSTFNYQNTSSIDYNVRFKFSFNVYNTDVNKASSLEIYVKVYNASTGFPTAASPITKILSPIALPQAISGATSYKSFDINVDAIVKVPAGYKASLIFANINVAAQIRISPFILNITPLRTINILVDDPSFSDIFNLQTSSNSRPLIVDINAKNAYYSTLVRYSQAYQQGTSINGTNRFYYLDQDTYDKKFGDIVRMKLHNRDLRIFQYKKCGVVPVFSVETLNQDGTNNLVASSKIVNPIRYYEGEFGIGNQPTSLATSGYADYFADPVKGYFLRLSQDGITPISELYKMQTFAGNNLPNYLSSHTYSSGGSAKILGVFYFSKDRDGEFISVLQPGTGLTGYTLAFNEVKNHYTSFYSFNPEAILNFENKLASFKNGQLYIHDSATRNNFYGTQYSSSITFVFNKDNILKKTFDYVTFDATDYWTSPTIGDVTTSLGQPSNLVQGDYEIYEGMYHGALQRDNNSLGGVINGDYLKGTWIQAKFSNSATSLVYLSGLYLGYQLSNRNL
jgi:hypothetical protein